MEKTAETSIPELIELLELKQILNSILFDDDDEVPSVEELARINSDLPDVLKAFMAVIAKGSFAKETVRTLDLAIRSVLHTTLEKMDVSVKPNIGRRVFVEKRKSATDQLLDNSKLTMQLQDEQSKNRILTEMQASHQENLALLQAEIDTLHADKEKLQDQVKQARRAMSEALSKKTIEQAQVQDKYEEASAELNVCNGMIETLKRQVDDLLEETSEKSNQILKLKQKVMTTKSILNESRRAQDALQKQLDSMKLAQRRMKIEATASRAVKDDMSRELKEENLKLRQQNILLIKENDKYFAELTQMNQSSQELSVQAEQTAEYEERLEEAKETIANVKSENAELMLELEDKTQKMNEQFEAFYAVAQERDDLRSEIEEMTRTLNKYDVKLEDLPVLRKHADENRRLQESLKKTRSTLDSLARFVSKLVEDKEACADVFIEDESLCDDDEVKEHVRSVLDECRKTFSQIGERRDRLGLFDAVFGHDCFDATLDDVMMVGKRHEYAAIVVLVSVIHRLQQFIALQQEALQGAYESIPHYENRSIPEDIVKYMEGLAASHSKLRDLVKQHFPHYRDRSDASRLLNQLVTDVAKFCEDVNTLRNEWDFKGSVFELPMYTLHSMNNMKESIDTMMRDNAKSTEDMKNKCETRVSELKKKLSNKESILFELREMKTRAANLQDQLREAHDALDEANAQRDETKTVIADLHKRIEELEMSSRTLLGDRDRLQIQLDDKTKWFQKRIADTVDNITRLHNEEMERVTHKHSEEENVLKQKVARQAKKLNQVREQSKRTITALEEDLSIARSEVQNLGDQNESLSATIVDLRDTNASTRIIESLQDRIADLTISRSSDSHLMHSINNDSIIDEIGEILSRAADQRVRWTKSKLIAVISGMVERLQDTENQSKWIEWAISVIRNNTRRGNEMMTPDQMRTTIQDLVISSTSTMRTMEMVKSLRYQKKILTSSAPREDDANSNKSTKSLILAATAAIILKNQIKQRGGSVTMTPVKAKTSRVLSPRSRTPKK